MIISLGEALIDSISRKDLLFEGFPGGSPMNTSIAISRLGIPCQFLGRISNDMFGCRLIGHLQENSVGTDMVLRTDDSTTLSFVQKQPDGQVVYGFFANNTADRNWSHKEMNLITLPEEVNIIHYGALLSYLHNKDWLDRKTLKNLNNDQLREIGDYANTAAGINCNRSGANPPTSSEMEDALGKLHL